jgi:hypothetical protein
MTMMVASGTSTPTSITVVATRIVLVHPLHPAVHQSDLVAEDRHERGETVLGRHQFDLFRLLDQRADPVDFLAFIDGGTNALDQVAKTIERQRHRLDRFAAGGFFREARHVHVAESGEHERARDRRRRHHQHVGSIPFSGQRKPLMDTEPVLLVDDGKHQVLERDAFLKQRMRADDDVD